MDITYPPCNFMLFLILIIAVILFVVYKKKVKKLRFGNMTVITGELKTGKSTLSLHLALKKFRSVHLHWTIDNFFRKLFHVKKRVEEPLFYCNVPVRCKHYCPLTRELLLREKRFRYKSVVYVQEASLVADSMYFKDEIVNEQLLLFNKLFCHETKGGYLFYDTQNVDDNHFAVKRCTGTYLHIAYKVNLPFFLCLKVQERLYSSSGESVNVNTGDLTDNYKIVFVPKSVWKKFDCYTFSILTDKLSVEDTIKHYEKNDSLKSNDIVSFKTYGGLKRENKK